MRRRWPVKIPLNPYHGTSLSIAFTTITVATLKIWTGALSPDFLAVCQPIANATMPRFGDYICRGNAAEVREARMSFPSSRAAYAAAGLAMASLYLGGRSRAWVVGDMGGGSRAWAVVISVAPVVGAIFVATTALVDNVHHTEDILAGLLIGLSFSYLAYRFYYRSLFDARSTGAPKCSPECGENGALNVREGDLETFVEAI
ncbi:PAP2 superfamily-domain-containing protein [Blyttiomyces helicus]|uniref:PAP2 superfamily-domain-containing protein n=1 Tax=Blyttiomyces helicus TaxID=388810 RepID=A0A4P9W054_9FUNG|nr:PAP2 superfamily-domain-containing protein [Blyttiomyces helicus]|eukprot:RKO84695.1 PAP2 superfamily-domain-containing protein [Blyttiomyces helicus]